MQKNRFEQLGNQLKYSNTNIFFNFGLARRCSPNDLSCEVTSICSPKGLLDFGITHQRQFETVYRIDDEQKMF